MYPLFYYFTRQAFTLRVMDLHVEGFKPKQIAELLGCTTFAVTSRRTKFLRKHKLKLNDIEQINKILQKELTGN